MLFFEGVVGNSILGFVINLLVLEIALRRMVCICSFFYPLIISDLYSFLLPRVNGERYCNMWVLVEYLLVR